MQLSYSLNVYQVAFSHELLLESVSRICEQLFLLIFFKQITHVIAILNDMVTHRLDDRKNSGLIKITDKVINLLAV